MGFLVRTAGQRLTADMEERLSACAAMEQSAGHKA